MNFSVDFQSLKPLTLQVPTVSTRLNISDFWGAVKVRWGIKRDSYSVSPGLYKVGMPNNQSDVFVTANYKLSFDSLRKNLNSLNAWILVLDTNGINVWCAAGKGTFGTNNLIKSIKNTALEYIVKHRKIIVPQLGAVGISAHKVKEQTGFKVVYGPIMAKDIKSFVFAGYKATSAMRKVTFPFHERAKLIPVDLLYGKDKLMIVLALLFFFSGLDRTGFIFSKMVETSPLILLSILGAYISGIVVAPLLLPFVPFRSFAMKGAFWGGVVTLILFYSFEIPLLEILTLGLFNVSIASFMTMNFTGSSTFTSLSGVKKEIKWALPFQITFALVGFILFIITKLI